MDINFRNRIEHLPLRLFALMNCSEKLRSDLGSVPEFGVYMFIEKGIPVYIGRSNRMKQRLLEHGRNSSGHNDASFAFLLAKKLANSNGIDINRKRKDLVCDEQFKCYFSLEKRRVANMSIKCVEIKDAVDQYLFEVYASEVLNTPYNDFDNH